MTDVCLVLEGTWPSTTGGVSTWVQGLLEGMHGLTVDVVHLRADDAASSTGAHFVPPPAVRHVIDVPLDPTRAELDPAVVDALPDAPVYHALSSSWAGAVAAATGRPVLLTEHGIAWREARSWAGELETGRTPIAGVDWGSVVGDLARQAYAGATHVTTVCEANARVQRDAGVPAHRLTVIPNAVALPPHRARVTPDPTAPTIGFIGRVVPIKDVATFLRACAVVAGAIPGARFVVAGPLDHDPAYAERCVALRDDLGLGHALNFTGTVDGAALAADLDLVVLTSRSEGAPMALLEAMAAGTPVVATDVGGCREVVGPGGLLTPVRQPAATAAAILRLVTDGQAWRAASTAARALAETRSPHAVVAAYRELYDRLAA